MKSGIYMIQNIVTGNRYIGSSRNLRHRKATHIYDMQNGARGNYKIKRDCAKYGKDAFAWTVIEFVEPERLVEREQYWIDLAKPEYNIRQVALNNCPTETELTKLANKKRSEKMTGRKASKETREKMSKSHKAYWSDPANRVKLKKTPEQKERLRWLATGERNGNWGTKRPKEFCDLVSQVNSVVQYTFVSPGGDEVTFSNLMKNGEKLTGIPYWALRSLYQGKTKVQKGWTFKEKIYVGHKKER